MDKEEKNENNGANLVPAPNNEQQVKISAENEKPAAKSRLPAKRFKMTRRAARVKPEFDQKILSVRRVARVMAGGRRFNFSVAVAVGNRKGLVGVGTGKAGDTPLAIEKAFRDAQKNLIAVPLTDDFSIPHETAGKVCSSRVLIWPAPGRGRIAGGSLRDVFELAGIQHINSKIVSRSKNRLNNAKAAIKALSQLTANNRQPTTVNGHF